VKNIIFLLAILSPTLNGMLAKSVSSCSNQLMQNFGCRCFSNVVNNVTNNVGKSLSVDESVKNGINLNVNNMMEKYKRIEEVKGRYFKNTDKKKYKYFGIFFEISGLLVHCLRNRTGDKCTSAGDRLFSEFLEYCEYASWGIGVSLLIYEKNKASNQMAGME